MQQIDYWQKPLETLPLALPSSCELHEFPRNNDTANEIGPV